jgi:hypothetical protein
MITMNQTILVIKKYSLTMVMQLHSFSGRPTSLSILVDIHAQEFAFPTIYGCQPHEMKRLNGP